MKNILIVDADLGFVFWLGRVLDMAGQTAFPARSVSDARALLAECQLAVDALILDPSLAGASEFVKALRKDRKNVKVVAVSDGSATAASAIDADAACDRPGDDFGEQTRLEWTRIVRRVLFEVCG